MERELLERRDGQAGLWRSGSKAIGSEVSGSCFGDDYAYLKRQMSGVLWGTLGVLKQYACVHMTILVRLLKCLFGKKHKGGYALLSFGNL